MTFSIKQFFLKNKYYVLLLFCFLLSLIDIGNPDALRQGTEGFYLQISKEMAKANNFLTPTYLGNRHWSKPPLHFILPRPAYLIFGINLFAARIIILILSFFSIFLISDWLKRNFDISKSLSLLLVISSFGFIKYSRIFMMEAPLMFFLTLSSLFYWDYLKTTKKKFLFLSIITSVSCSLIKGPVSLGIQFTAFSCFHFYEMYFLKQNNLKKFFYFWALSTIFSSIWYLLSYINFGKEFFDYFFIRENLGKFNAKSYPVTSVISGLIIFSFPHIFSLLDKKIIIKIKNLKTNPCAIFIYFNFVVSYFIWFLPKQKSHHYAIPSLIFFLILILLILQKDKRHSTKPIYDVINFIMVLFLITISLLTSTIFSKEFTETSLITISVSSLFSVTVFLLSKYKIRDLRFQVLSFFITVMISWNIIAPNYYLPLIPNEHINKLKVPESLAVIYRKPFFIEEVIQRKFKVLDPARIPSRVSSEKGTTLVRKSVFDQFEINKTKYKVIAKWSLWRRGVKLSEVIKAIQNKSLKELKEEMLIIRH